MQLGIGLLGAAVAALVAGASAVNSDANALPKKKAAFQCSCACVVAAENMAYTDGKVIDSAANCSSLNGKQCTYKTGTTKSGAQISKTGKYDFCINADGS